VRTALMLFVAGAVALSAAAQEFTSEHEHMDMASMPGMHQHAPEVSAMNMTPPSLTESLEQHAAGGTDVAPSSTPSPMLMKDKNGWMLMLHGVAFLNEVQQSGRRGSGKFFSTNWLMPMAQRKLGSGTFTVRAMFSLEPATVTQRRYPELFQQGETAYGRHLIDGQHPHDFVMELAAMYDYKAGEKTLLSLYAAPVGAPALGPMAYPHRESAAENPLAPLGHHLQDSTHITNDVVTLGITHRRVRVEASGFHGREPDEQRWNIDSGRIDSWSARVTVNPAKNWSAQYSIGQLHSPEALAAEEDVRRMTASVAYNRPFAKGNWASLLAWGRNQSLSDGNIGNGYLLESTLQFMTKNRVWTRIENVDRTNDLLLSGTVTPPGFAERYFARVQAYTAGYDREVGNWPHLSVAIGGQFTAYGVDDKLKASYGDHPVAGLVFLRVRLK